MISDLEEKIKESIKKRKGIATTTQILLDIYEEIKEIEEKLQDRFLEESHKKEYKRKKEKFQRRLLYHLNKLEKEGIIKEIGKTERGEKIFELREKKIMHVNHKGVYVHINKYKEEGILHIYSEQDFIDAVNCVVLDCREIFENGSTDRLDKILKVLMANINDVVGFHNACCLFKNEEKVEEIIETIDKYAELYNKKASIEIDPLEIDKGAFMNLVNYLSKKDGYMEIILRVEKNNIDRYKDYLIDWIEKLKSKASRLNIYFTNGNSNAIAIGNAGVYYARKQTKQPLSIIAGMSFIVDLGRITQLNNKYNIFRKIVDSSVRSMINLNLKQSDAFLSFYNLPVVGPLIEDTNIVNALDHYIRLWNYDWRDFIDQNLLELLKSTIKSIATFTRSQEIVMAAAGFPQRISVAFNSAFPGSIRELSKRKYPKRTIFGIKDLMSEETRTMLSVREELSTIYGMPDRVRIFRGGIPKGEDVYRELLFLANTTNLKLITIDFGRREGEVSLTQFINGR